MSWFTNVDQIKAAWTNIRDTYTKMLREKNKSGAEAFQPKGSKRILIWGNANFLHSNVAHTKHSHTVSLKRRREVPHSSDIEDDLQVDSTPTSQSNPTGLLHLPQQQGPSRPESSGSVGTSQYLFYFFLLN